MAQQPIPVPPSVPLPPGQNAEVAQAIENLSIQVQSLQLQVEVLNVRLDELNSHMAFNLEALQLGLYYAVFFFVLGLVFGVAAAMIRRMSRY
jgi:uncharacterized membrane protein YGL010W